MTKISKTIIQCPDFTRRYQIALDFIASLAKDGVVQTNIEELEGVHPKVVFIEEFPIDADNVVFVNFVFTNRIVHRVLDSTNGNIVLLPTDKIPTELKDINSYTVDENAQDQSIQSIDQLVEVLNHL